MYINMPINVISKACEKCPRFRVIVSRDYKGDKISEVDMECANYDDCLNALDMYQQGEYMREQEGKKR